MVRTTLPVKHYPGQRWWYRLVRRNGCLDLDSRGGLRISGSFPNSKAAEAALEKALSRKWLTHGEGYVLTKSRNGKWIITSATDGVLGERFTADLVPTR